MWNSLTILQRGLLRQNLYLKKILLKIGSLQASKQAKKKKKLITASIIASRAV